MKKQRVYYKSIRVNGEKKDLHRHVMEKALGRKLMPNEDVHHINENPFDNRIENLQILSHAEHSKLHKCQGGYSPRIDRRKLNSGQVKEIKRLHTNGFSSRKIAARYGVDKNVILNIIRGVYYKDVV